ncbi:unnamed protein product [Mytilus coruscus]|uniref:Uncharacterized protein n=1 Tax=Mytilus coruscus TaxID=42192 RepID=A0A6J8AUX9_MYTCO|nr:unnamed protein product [Mytilus coruscus]
MGLTDVAFTIKLAFYFILFGFILHTIGFGAPYWATGYNSHAGLWQYCSRSRGICVSIDMSLMDRKQVDKFTALKVLECFGFTGSVACLISICIFIFGGRCSESKFITVFNIFLFLATGTVIVIATIMFATMISDLDWAFDRFPLPIACWYNSSDKFAVWRN